MDSILFSLKRAFHLSSALGRRLLESEGLTPSRFDMLFVIHSNPGRREIYQSHLRYTLGVTAPTVSRMLRSLEALGLVRKRREIHGDRRQRIVWLTVRGRALIRRAVRFAIRRRAARRLVGSFIAKRWWRIDVEFAARDRIDRMLWRVRQRLFDKAVLVYPWHPDD